MVWVFPDLVAIPMVFCYLPPPLLRVLLVFMSAPGLSVDLMVSNIDALTPLVTVVLPIRIRLRQMILCPLSSFFIFIFISFLVQSIIDLY